jgi:hypothetical protein
MIVCCEVVNCQFMGIAKLVINWARILNNNKQYVATS